MKRSLISQFLLAFITTSALIIIMLSVAVVWSMRDGFARYLLHEELGLFSEMAKTLTRTYNPASPNWPELTQDAEIWNAFVLQFCEQPKFEKPDTPEGKLMASPPSIESKLFLLDANRKEIVAPQLRGNIVATMPIPSPIANQAPVGWIGLSSIADEGADTTSFFLRGQYENLAIVSIAALFVSILAAIMMGQRLIGPIKALAVGARSISEGNLTIRIPHKRRDELGQLIDDTNSMAQNLETARAAEKRWISDTSHEMQTPLAVLRAQVEAIQDGIEKADDTVLEQMHDAVMRLSQVVDDIRTLSFADEGQMCPSDTGKPFDLSELLHARTSHAKRRLSDAGIDLTIDSPETIMILGDAKRLAQVIDNILENSCRYTDGPGKLAIRASRKDDRITLQFDDTPPVPDQPAIDQLFDRFFRAESSRSREHGGSGLGLAICKAIIKAHGGTISASQSPLGGLRIQIDLPVGASENEQS